jgi:hypothetical protein
MSNKRTEKKKKSAWRRKEKKKRKGREVKGRMSLSFLWSQRVVAVKWG